MNDELNRLQEAAHAFLTVRFLRASNRVRFGTPDPTGGNGPQPYPLSYYLKELS